MNVKKYVDNHGRRKIVPNLENGYVQMIADTRLLGTVAQALLAFKMAKRNREKSIINT